MILWKYEIGKHREALLRSVAWHLPRELVMWCYMRVAAHATTGKFGNTIVPELGMMDAVKRWDESISE